MLQELWNFEEQVRKPFDYPTFCHPSLSMPSHTPHFFHLLSSHATESFLVSPALSTPSVLHFVHPVFFCPSLPLVLTPKLNPLKSPSNKLWCLGSSLLSRSPHPSSLSAATSAVKAGSVQKAQPLRSVQCKRVSV